jgi:hypothetical protein
MGPFSRVEDGGHVRRGYTTGMLHELCKDAGLIVEEIATCSGFVSQQITKLHRIFGRFGWLTILPIRFFGWLLDPLISRLGVKGYSICMIAYKPRFADAGVEQSAATPAMKVIGE